MDTAALLLLPAHLWGHFSREDVFILVLLFSATSHQRSVFIHDTHLQMQCRRQRYQSKLLRVSRAGFECERIK